MPIKDAFALLIKIFHRHGAELVKDVSDFHASIGLGVASIAGSRQQPIRMLTVLVQFRRIVMKITQDKTHVCGNFAQQNRSRKRQD